MSHPLPSGRFGNQADHFLGALGFAHRLNRTLVLPPWVEYRTGELRSRQVPFDHYFNVSILQQFHRVRTMADFMQNTAPTLWPPAARISFCYMARKALGTGTTAAPDRDADAGSCNAKDGNPFGPFWDEFGIDFAGSQFFGPLSYDLQDTGPDAQRLQQRWHDSYPAAQWPVLAFTGAPAAFPVQPHNLDLQRHLRWNDRVATAAREYIRTALPRGAFLGVHLRNGIDWVRACEHIQSSPNLFAAAQCLGYRNERGRLTTGMCMPLRDTIVRKIKRVIKESREAGAQQTIRSVFVASDSNHMVRELSDSLHRMRVTVHRLPENDPHLDLAVLGQANHFIGNCVSSFTAFVKRERDVHGFPSSFWGYPVERREKLRAGGHEEL